MSKITCIRILVALLFTFSNPIFAQWEQTNDLYSGFVYSLAVSGTNLFAGTWGGVFLSTDNGTSWTRVNNGLTKGFVNALAVSGTNLFAGTGCDGVFLSTNNGKSWTQVNTGLTDTVVWSLAVSGTNLFAGTEGGGVFLSTNNGKSWTEVNTGLTNTYVLSLALPSSWGSVTNVLDEYLCSVPRRFGHESLCRDFARRLSFDQ